MRVTLTDIMLCASLLMTFSAETQTDLVLQRPDVSKGDTKTGSCCTRRGSCMSADIGVNQDYRTAKQDRWHRLTESHITSTKESNEIFRSLTFQLEKLANILESVSSHGLESKKTLLDSGKCVFKNGKSKCKKGEKWNQETRYPQSIPPEIYHDIELVLPSLNDVMLAATLKRTLTNISQTIFNLAENLRAFHQNVETEMSALEEDIKNGNINPVPMEISGVLVQNPADLSDIVLPNTSKREQEKSPDRAFKIKPEAAAAGVEYHGVDGLLESDPRLLATKRILCRNTRCLFQAFNGTWNKCMARDFRHHLMGVRECFLHVDEEGIQSLSQDNMCADNYDEVSLSKSSQPIEALPKLNKGILTFSHLASIIFLILSLGVVVTYFWHLENRRYTQDQTHVDDNTELKTSTTRTLGILIISHDEDTEDQIKVMLNKVIQQTTDDPKWQVCFRHLTPESSMSGVFHQELQRADKVMVFVDARPHHHHEDLKDGGHFVCNKNIIKDFPIAKLSKDVGDIALIIYGDEESRCLPRGCIVSRKIAAHLPTLHLRGLYRKERLLTINKGFTNTQTVHLRALLSTSTW